MSGTAPTHKDLQLIATPQEGWKLEFSNQILGIRRINDRAMLMHSATQAHLLLRTSDGGLDVQEVPTKGTIHHIRIANNWFSVVSALTPQKQHVFIGGVKKPIATISVKAFSAHVVRLDLLLTIEEHKTPAQVASVAKKVGLQKATTKKIRAYPIAKGKIKKKLSWTVLSHTPAAHSRFLPAGPDTFALVGWSKKKEKKNRPDRWRYNISLWPSDMTHGEKLDRPSHKVTFITLEPLSTQALHAKIHSIQKLKEDSWIIHQHRDLLCMPRGKVHLPMRCIGPLQIMGKQILTHEEGHATVWGSSRDTWQPRYSAVTAKGTGCLLSTGQILTAAPFSKQGKAPCTLVTLLRPEPQFVSSGQQKLALFAGFEGLKREKHAFIPLLSQLGFTEDLEATSKRMYHLILRARPGGAPKISFHRRVLSALLKTKPTESYLHIYRIACNRKEIIDLPLLAELYANASHILLFKFPYTLSCIFSKRGEHTLADQEAIGQLVFHALDYAREELLASEDHLVQYKMLLESALARGFLDRYQKKLLSRRAERDDTLRDERVLEMQHKIRHLALRVDVNARNIKTVAHVIKRLQKAKQKEAKRKLVFGIASAALTFFGGQVFDLLGKVADLSDLKDLASVALRIPSTTIESVWEKGQEKLCTAVAEKLLSKAGLDPSAELKEWETLALELRSPASEARRAPPPSRADTLSPADLNAIVPKAEKLIATPDATGWVFTVASAETAQEVYGLLYLLLPTIDAGATIELDGADVRINMAKPEDLPPLLSETDRINWPAS